MLLLLLICVSFFVFGFVDFLPPPSKFSILHSMSLVVSASIIGLCSFVSFISVDFSTPNWIQMHFVCFFRLMKVSIRLWTAFMVILKLIRRQKVLILPLKTFAICPSIIRRFAIKDHLAFIEHNHERERVSE